MKPVVGEPRGTKTKGGVPLWSGCMTLASAIGSSLPSRAEQQPEVLGIVLPVLAVVAHVVAKGRQNTGPEMRGRSLGRLYPHLELPGLGANA